jgi:3-hydroxybutyryl-CoA dehydrogenase
MLEAIGKWPVLVSTDLPGYLVNRLQFALLREAFYLIDEGFVTPTDLDRLVRGSLSRRWPVLGLMRQADLAGLDVYLRVFENLGPHLYSSSEPPKLLTAAVANGQTGADVGRGMFDWADGEAEAIVRRRNEWLIRMLREDQRST